jgi:tRNA dimethylallyltransferase
VNSFFIYFNHGRVKDSFFATHHHLQKNSAFSIAADYRLFSLTKISYSGLVNKAKVIAIVGPTSSGKTALGIYLAQKLDGEVISADSRQVYKGLDLGTGKVTTKEMAGIPHHLLDVTSPKKIFSASDFKKLGEKALLGVLQKQKTPIVVGGTGLYADVLLGRMVLPEVAPNPKLRAQLEKKSTSQLFALLKKKDPARAANIEPGNKRRLVRALEIAYAIGTSPAKAGAMEGMEHYNVLWLGINPGFDKLQKNINKRLQARIKAGMLAEAKRLHTAGLSYKRMEELGLEYRSMANYLQNKISKEEMVLELERAIGQYAKRQLRWFKRNSNIAWVKNKTEALQLAKKFIQQH